MKLLKLSENIFKNAIIFNFFGTVLFSEILHLYILTSRTYFNSQQLKLFQKKISIKLTAQSKCGKIAFSIFVYL